MSKAICKATPEIQALAKEAIQIQDACNMGGLSTAFAAHIKALFRCDQYAGTSWVNQHPITKAWVDKFTSLARIQDLSGDWKYHDQVDDLANGIDIEFELED